MIEEAVAECAVVGIKDELKGQMPLGFCVMKKRKSSFLMTLMFSICIYTVTVTNTVTMTSSVTDTMTNTVSMTVAL